MTIQEFKQFCLIKAEKHEILKEFIWNCYDELTSKLEENDFNLEKETLYYVKYIEKTISKVDRFNLGNFITISYNPGISTSLKAFCEKFCSHRMSSEDSILYNIEDIHEKAEDNNYEVLEDDKLLLDVLVKSNVEYIEF